MRTKSLKYALILCAITYVTILIAAPTAVVFIQAFSKGFESYWHTITYPMATSAFKRSCIVCLTTLCINLIIGTIIAWLLTTYNFRGKTLLNVLIDIPITISPVIAGAAFLLLLGSEHQVGRFLASHGITLVFSIYGVILISVFTTFPYIVRQLIVAMKHRNFAYEEAASTLGANQIQIFFYIIVPTIKNGFLYAIALCASRILGEYGAVLIISGHIMGYTDTVPLYIETLYNTYDIEGAFAMATTLLPVCFIPLFFIANKKHVS